MRLRIYENGIIGEVLVKRHMNERHNFRIIAIAHILLASCLITIPIFYGSQPVEATDWGEAAGAGLIGAQVGAIAAFACFDGVGSIVGAGAGFLTGMIGDLIGQDQREAAGALDAKGPYAHELRNITSNYLGMADSAAQNTVANFESLSYFFARKAEFGALQLYEMQSANHTDFAYDSHYVLTRSEVANGTQASMYYIASQYESLLNQYSNLTDSFQGAYEGLSWGYGTGGEEYSSRLGTNSYREALVGYEMNTNGSGYVTIAAGYVMMIYNRGTISKDVEMTVSSRNGDIVFQKSAELAPGEGVQFTVPVSGDYKIRSSSAQDDIAVFGIMSEAIDQGQRPVGTILTRCIGDRGLVVDGHGIDTIWFGDRSDPDCCLSLLSIYAKLDSISYKVTKMQRIADGFGQAYFRTLQTAGATIAHICPDCAFPDPANLENMTPEQIYCVYLAYLVAMKEWFKNYTIMDPSDVNISEESLKLKVRGAIFSPNGTMLFGPDTVFTPYISLDSVELVKGNNTIDQPCFAMRWGATSTGLTDFKNISDLLYIDLPIGSHLDIREIFYNGSDVDHLKLNVTKVTYVIHDTWSPISPPQTISIEQWLLRQWYLFPFLFGITVALSGAFARNRKVLYSGAIFLIVGAVGWLFSSVG